MKLYHFTPPHFGTEYFVMSDSEENAIKAVNQYLIDEHEKEHKYGYGTKLYLWEDFTSKYKGYNIEVLDANKAIAVENG